MLAASALALALLACAAAASQQCSGTANTLPVYDGAPSFVRNVTNGKLFVTGAEDLSPRLMVAHVYGSPYEMGYAHGQLLRDSILQAYSGLLEYIYEEVDSYIQFLPPAIREWIEKEGVEFALNVTYWLTKPFIPDHFNQEIQGLADSVGLPFDYVMRITLFPELIQAACSMLGAWGQSIANTSGSEGLYQLRALDWNTNTPLQQWPLLLVYHPSDSQSHAFSTLTWAGFVGAITGYSSADVAVCEKVWSSYNGQQNRAGYPWHFLMRDILQFDMSIDDALSRIASATRTCSIFIGLGDSSHTFNAVEYSYEVVRVFNDHNMPNHTQFHNVVYVDKHLQPSSDPCLPSLIQDHYGNLDALTMLRHVTAEFQTGDMHIAVFDFSTRDIYVSNASPYNNVTQSATPAYARPFTKVNLKDMFNEPSPTTTHRPPVTN